MLLQEKYCRNEVLSLNNFAIYSGPECYWNISTSSSETNFSSINSKYENKCTASRNKIAAKDEELFEHLDIQLIIFYDKREKSII